jgi:hypothetical protein
MALSACGRHAGVVPELVCPGNHVATSARGLEIWARFETKRPNADLCCNDLSEAMVVVLSDEGPACKKCGVKMEMVADIAPLGKEPGLRAFLCDRCGAADNVLVYRTHRSTATKQ